jgi:hypothetical protein
MRDKKRVIGGSIQVRWPSRLIASLVFLILSPLARSASTVDQFIHFPDVVTPGQTITIFGKFDTSKGPSAAVLLHGVDSSSAANPAIGTVAPNGAAITFQVPDRLPPGRYAVTLDFDDLKDQPIPGELRVQGNAVVVDSVYPATRYENEKGTFDFEIVGHNFSKVPEDNMVYLVGPGQIIEAWGKDRAACEAKPDKTCLWPESTEKLHVVGYRRKYHEGSLEVYVGLRNVYSSPKPLVLSRLSETGVLVWAVIIFVIVGLIVYGILVKGIKANTIDGQLYSKFWSFFIDRQTNSYSLSKFQLLLFFSVFVFGYLYVFLCRWLVQWHFELPDVPSTTSGLLAMSVGTTIAAAGATAAHGSKGAGPIRPSAADFISSGGQVVPERFQFFVWTLVACFGFLALLLSQNPATLDGFPTFPQGLLYVMGVSAGGYLGGKVVRAAGPVIRNIIWDSTSNVITVEGENLSSEADFFIDGQKLPIDPKAVNKLVNGVPQDQASDRTFCSQLKITVNPIAGVDLSRGEHVFRIMNKDGQFADIRFTADLPVIIKVLMADNIKVDVPAGADANKVIKASDQNSKIEVNGSGFREGAMATWTPPGGSQPLTLTASAVVFKSSQSLSLTLVPGTGKGTGTLLLAMPSGFSAVANVTVA